ncbi:two-component system sensor histidine kinase YesM [Paenibacillus sp. SORGH_AS306]|uniref:sensor histidine kinase n=1 Tax=unclassified Paenibacillus TaxID=185978 RepID=UPI00278B02E9|nr:MULTISPECIES: sensor histidine kinase [unclassified Paenibacillus]MDQ1234597.1 two-component system sensor histidine kinase YesM [Paenibacillus sp. SORGH_AS_0306]MDR6111642.1 two-component system sensor histidine kinase YesM [Paenibacillus sp. SORGH_AS_0338]
MKKLRWRKIQKIKKIGKVQHLGTQLIVFFMAISIIVFSIASYSLYSFMLGLIKEQNEKLLLQQFQQLDHNIHSLVGDVDRLSKLFLLDDHVQNYIQNTNMNTEIDMIDLKKAIYGRITNFISNYNYIHSIYIISDTRGALGGNTTQTLVHGEQTWTDRFFQSDGYEKAKQAFPNLIIEGGIKESYYNPYNVDQYDGNLVSLIRGVRPIYEPRTNATLVFNIDETYLASTYAASLDMAEGDMYIVNEQGVIISANRAEQVGTQSPYSPLQNSYANFGSYDITRDHEPLQVVYYKLQDANWYLVREVPLTLFSEQITAVQRIMLIVFSLSILVIFCATYFWLRKLIRPLHLLAHKMKNVSQGELGVTFTTIPNNEFGMVMRRFNEMSLSIVELLRSNNEIQEKRRELEIEALQYQINPHFLYNTLNMIRWMASAVKADHIVNSVVALGNILRPVFASKDTMCSLRDEINYLENYIKIINYRFNNTITFTFDIEPSYLDYRIPRFILQPLIENSTKSGRPDDNVIDIAIEVYEQDNDLWISVIDSGRGFDPQMREQLNNQLQSGDSYTSEQQEYSSGVGLYNVNKRIQLYFGKEYGIQLPQVPYGAEVAIHLPRLLESKDHIL